MTLPTIEKTAILFAGDLLPVEGLQLPREWAGAHVVANLEGCVSAAPEGARKAHYAFVQEAACRTLVAQGVSAVSLANNHVYDAGRGAFDRMVGLLRDAGVTVFGLRDAPFVALNVGGRRCAVVASLERCRSRRGRVFAEEHVEPLVRRLRADFDDIFVMPHWGAESEFVFWPSPSQVNIARRWIAAGATAVLGSHPHVLQGRIFIDGRRAYFSLGNLYFPHEEALLYPTTDVGLVVQYSAREPWDVREGFVLRDGCSVRPITRGQATMQALQALLEAVSSDLGPAGAANSWLGWASCTGSTYCQKSRESWRRRSESWPVRTLFMRTLWTLFPKTVLLHWGERNRNAEALFRTGAMVARVEDEVERLRSMGTSVVTTCDGPDADDF